MLFALLNLLIVAILCSTPWGDSNVDPRSPYYQHLPDCDKRTTPNVIKKTDRKGVVCPMIKDEIGFLSEFVAFYEMMGFNEVVFYDNNSTSSTAELKPWIDTGFVTIVQDWGQASIPGLFKNKKKKYLDMMRVKFAAEVHCKASAAAKGYEVFVSVDMDEYVLPRRSGLTVMDDLMQWFDETTRGIAVISKLQFPPTPHILEPVNLLTLEAYQTRMGEPGRMNYYTSVSNKVALRLQGSKDYTNTTTAFLVHCCDFHGCGNFNVHAKCKQWFQEGERWNIDGKHRKWIPTPRINHYARSLEKYILKQGTWDTAGNGRDYDTYNFLDRVSGFKFDNSALEWTCQLRELLRNRTGEQHYLRPGDVWYRNPEFGKTVSDARK
ncbi:hypothetical protein B484DRAFT_458779, partial [Ochromonadaceae sp. CCMP2298]